MALVCVSDYEKKAAESMARIPWDYYRGGAGDEISLRLNRRSYDHILIDYVVKTRIRIRPRVLVDVSKRNTRCNLLGIDLDLPVAIGPTSMQKLAHQCGETATAKAAGKLNTIFVLSTLSTSSIEEVAEVAPDTNKWFQLYVYKDQELTKNLVKRAEKSGYKAIVLTVDAAIFGTRRTDMRNRFQLPDHIELANFANGSFKSTDGSVINEFISRQFNATFDWDDVRWLCKFTHLPILLKGILTHEDATLALKTGCKGIIVSNHGGRQLDTVPASIEALPEIVKAVGSELVVMIDGGIRNGTDVFKALALGAKCVFIGRPVLYGLAVNGQKGVEDILEILKNELDTTMALAGVNNVSEINSTHVAHKSDYKLSKL